MHIVLNEKSIENKLKINKLEKREILHMIRVAEYSLRIAEELGVENIELIHTSGRLHDIGKAHIDSNILTMDRPYRKALTKDKALKIMEHERNNYDPKVFEVFKKLLQKGEL